MIEETTKKGQPMKAWHFINNKRKLRDGRPMPKVGEKLVHDGELEMYYSGLHASKKLMDALWYAPGSIICRVECSGKILHDKDKLVCTERTILWTYDATEVLRDFARRCALDVVDLWDAPDVVVRYLKTGDESLKQQACDAARAATDAFDAAYAAAYNAYAAARAAYDAAAHAAAYAAYAAYAAFDAVRKKQNNRLTSMISAGRKINKP
jgi:hypothetical protein